MDTSDRLPKHLAIAFFLAALLYASFFTCDQALRKRKGPWEVTFQTNNEGHASIVINQPRLNISNVQIHFLGETNVAAAGVVRFDKPKTMIPFGKIKFEDLTYLPGSVAFDFFGHEVELLPRTLYLNKQEHAWEPNMAIRLTPSERLAPGMSYDPKEKKRRR